MNCIEAPGADFAGGYRATRVGGRQRLAHRVAWEQANGPIPAGFVIHHECGNKACINVAHLQAMTASAHSSIRRIDVCPRCGTTERYQGGCVECKRRYTREWKRSHRRCPTS